MKLDRKMTLTPVAIALAAISFVASGATLRVANQGDSLSMDPHSLNESLQLSVTGNVFEPLVTRGRDFKLTPALASLQSRGFKVALVTDGRMSGASGAVPAAIHVSPECFVPVLH